MERDDQESPTSSPVPGPSRTYEDEMSMAGEAEAYRSGDDGEELLAGPSYRGYLAGEEPSPAPSHSGLQPDLDIINVHQEDSMSLSSCRPLLSMSFFSCRSFNSKSFSSFCSLDSTSRFNCSSCRSLVSAGALDQLRLGPSQHGLSWPLECQHLRRSGGLGEAAIW